ncbi:hypothetical protein AMJ80_12340 [bacterium SM23_31]|nr:MAG: hypothetical protein AMJ80_12340 [bacterium SM23_31]
MLKVPEKHHRRSIRLKEYDYTRPGAYFVTICTHNSECLFGEIRNGTMCLNEYGNIVDIEWRRTGEKRKNIVLDAYVVMPNHFHGILFMIDTRRGIPPRRDCAPTNTENDRNYRKFGEMISGSLPAIIRSFKSAATKKINNLRNERGTPLWQRNYYEHIIRNDADLQKIREYITNNPLKWELDRYNPRFRVRGKKSLKKLMERIKHEWENFSA